MFRVTLAATAPALPPEQDHFLLHDVPWDITSRSIPRQPIYAGLGVPEVWRFDGRLTVLLLRPGAEYIPTASSLAFPFLPMASFESFVHRLAAEPQNAVLREFRDWVKTLR